MELKYKKNTAMEKELYLHPRQTATVKIGFDRGILYANDYALKMFGYDLTEFIGQKPRIVCHEDMPHIIHDMIGAIVFNYEKGIAVLKHRTKDGDYFWAFTYYKPSYKADGTFESFVTMRKPLPDKKINGTEENLRKQIGKLYTAVKEIESLVGYEQALKYMDGFLEDKGYKTLREYYMSFFDFKEEELEKFFAMDKNTPEKEILRYYDRSKLLVF